MNIWNFISTNLQEKKKVVLLIVIESNGSSPGRLGFKMAIADNNQTFGSIGGGIMEYKMVEVAKKLFSGKTFEPYIQKQNHNKKSEKNQSGMICSGNQTILFYPLESITTNIEIFSEVVQCINNNCKSVLSFSPQGIIFGDTVKLEQHFSSEITNETRWLYHEKISFKNEVYIIGGGHVGLALSQTMVQLGFYVSVFDNRPALNTMEQNSFAHKKQVVDYQTIESYIPEGENIYVVIMTFKHISDKDILRSLLHRKYKYIGLMGSKTKVAKIFADFRTQGYTDDDLLKVHSPIGISIKSETPEEIAISIAAEVIMVKNKKTS